MADAVIDIEALGGGEPDAGADGANLVHRAKIMHMAKITQPNSAKPTKNTAIG